MQNVNQVWNACINVQSEKKKLTKNDELARRLWISQFDLYKAQRPVQICNELQLWKHISESIEATCRVKRAEEKHPALI